MSPSEQESEFDRKNYIQIRRIETDRWFEGIRIKKDPREDSYYDLEWVLKEAEWFCKQWEICQCKKCRKWKDCGYKLEMECINFKEI